MESLKCHSDKLWLVTGAAGFIGSHIVEYLVRQGQKVRTIDNFITGDRKNLSHIDPKGFEFIEGDICDEQFCSRITEGVDIILHQAALGSVPRSIKEPMSTHRNNVDGTVNLLRAAHLNKVRRFVYASSSSVYGDHQGLPKVESQIGNPLSPYALSKRICEEYADLYFRQYQMETVGLRYFNVFGPRQNPEGPYAAVIPRWMRAIQDGQSPVVYGDGLQSRDFSYVDNVVAANIQAALTTHAEAYGQVFNIAYGQKTSLLDLFKYMKAIYQEMGYPHTEKIKLDHQPHRRGDIQHSLADIKRAQTVLQYNPQVNVEEGLRKTIHFFIQQT